MAATAAGVAMAPGHDEAHTLGFTPDQSNQPQVTQSANTQRSFMQKIRRPWGANKSTSPSDHATPSSDSSSSLDNEKKDDGYEIEQVETSQTTFETAANGLLYNEGRLVMIPAASPDPRDPMNLPMMRKAVAIGFLCVFGAMAASAELILGSMLPVFALYYAGLDVSSFFITLEKLGGLPQGSDPIGVLADLPNAAPIQEIYLLASLPVLMFGVANLFLIPTAIAVGRRPVILGCGLCAIGGALWAGFSGSLGSHLGARCVQALGAGTVESLIPFIVQDMVPVHQRNTAISGVFAAQGVIIIGLGIATPYIIIYLNWRWVYYMTAAAAGLFIFGVFVFLPETRYPRTKAMMRGEVPIVSEEVRRNYKPRNFMYDIQIFTGPKEWRKGVQAFIDTLTTFFYPHIFFITMLNSAMIGAAFAAAYIVAPALLTKPYSWPFLNLGLCLIPVLIAAIMVGFISGKLADMIANWAAKRRGRRIPENQILNLIVPTIVGLIGTVIFGLGGSQPENYPWIVFLLGLGFMTFGFLGANTIGAVYVLESYPNLAGPALVNIASFRCLIAFLISFRISEWIVGLGYLNAMMIYTGIIGFFACLLPVVYIYGPAWRERWPGPQGSAI